MAMLRSFGATSLTTRSPMRMVPSLTSSNPARQRRAVVLPHPEGPTNTRNSRSCTSIDRSLRASTLSKRLVTCSNVTLAMVILLSVMCGRSILDEKLGIRMARSVLKSTAILVVLGRLLTRARPVVEDSRHLSLYDTDTNCRQSSGRPQHYCSLTPPPNRDIVLIPVTFPAS